MGAAGAGGRAVIALSTGSLYTYGFARIFELAAEAGFDGVEVVIDGRLDACQPAYLRRLSAEYGLPVVVLHSPFAVDVPGWPGDQLGRLQRTVALAREVGVRTVVTHLPFRFYALIGHWHAYRPRGFLMPVPLPRREPYYRFLHEGLAELEIDSGVTIAVENMPANRFLGRRFSYYAFNSLPELGHFPHLTFDTTHWGTWDADLLAAYERLKGRIAHVHLSNFDGREHRAPDEGRLPLDGLLARLAQDGYNGTVTVETGPDALHAGDEAACRATLQRVLRFCRKHFSHEHEEYQ